MGKGGGLGEGRQAEDRWSDQQPDQSLGKDQDPYKRRPHFSGPPSSGEKICWALGSLPEPLQKPRMDGRMDGAVLEAQRTSSPSSLLACLKFGQMLESGVGV